MVRIPQRQPTLVSPICSMAFYNSSVRSYDDDLHYYNPPSFDTSYSAFDGADSGEVLPFAAYDYTESFGSYELDLSEVFPPSNEFVYPHSYTALDSSFHGNSNFRVWRSQSSSTNPKFITFFDKAPELQTRVPAADADFEEFDPTPYGGGYDIVSTYGNPLPFSDQTCYPRSGITVNLDPPFLPPPQPVADKNPVLSLPMEHGQGGKVSNGGTRVDSRDGGGDEGYEQSMVPVHEQTPHGYGLEAVDICESIFGPWPCLNRGRRERCCCHYHGRDSNPWTSAADYLFGDPNPYRYGYEDDRKVSDWF